MSHESVFALIVDRKIELYPLTFDDINVRNNPMEDYYYCFDEPLPTITHPAIEYIEAVPKLIGQYVQVEHVLRRKSLEAIFELIGLVPEHTITIEQVTPELLDAVVVLTKERVQQRLDTFAQTRGYDDIKSVCTYITSQIPSYQVEAERAIYLRDLTWSTLYQYLNGILSATTPLPSAYSEIEAVLPALTWA